MSDKFINQMKMLAQVAFEESQKPMFIPNVTNGVSVTDGKIKHTLITVLEFSYIDPEATKNALGLLVNFIDKLFLKATEVLKMNVTYSFGTVFTCNDYSLKKVECFLAVMKDGKPVDAVFMHVFDIPED